MLTLRSLIFNIAFMGWSFFAAFLLSPYFLGPARTCQKVGPIWARVSLWLARHIAGMTYEIRGREHIPQGPAIYASKHQSAWDTVIFHLLFDRAAFVLKRELLRIPCWGWYLWRMQMIAIDRSAGSSSIKHMIKQSKAALADGRPIIIFPEGTRTRPGATPDYQPGIAAMYAMLDAPVVPVALNSGLYWGKDAFIKKPGKLILEFLPAIPAGLDKQVFLQQLQERIETASDRLRHEVTLTNRT